jgi:hypothetical protein
VETGKRLVMPAVSGRDNRGGIYTPRNRTDDRNYNRIASCRIFLETHRC